MTRRDYCLQQADQEIRRLIREGFGLFRIAELYDVPVIRYCNDARAELDTNWQALPDYIKAQGHGVITEPYLREALADQVEEILNNETREGQVLCLQRAG